MKVVLGLGNPGRRYARTRHNVGWWVLEHLADVWHLDGWRRDGEAEVAAGRIDDAPVRLIKPLTYMNLSGEVLRPYSRRTGWSPATDLLVVVDDVALPVGALRLRARGSHGGHNGLRSIEQTLGTREYPRLRLGIRPADSEQVTRDLADFVLSPFGTHERAEVLALLPTCAEAVMLWLHDGIERAMNRFNAGQRV